jgi:uncharacterized RDD family membrane protein YckC
MNYANFWVRFVASFIDGIILNIFGSIAGFIAGLIIGLVFVASTGSTGDTGAVMAAQTFGFFLGVIITWLYQALLESSPRQATLGKQAMSIIVTDLNGDRISFGKATVRSFSKYLSVIILLIGYIMAAFTEKKQALHDIIAGTLVVTR